MACCDYVPGQTSTAAGRIGGSLAGGIRGGAGGGSSRMPQGIIEQIAAAIDQAIHSGDSLPGSGGGGGVGSGGSTGNVIDFPMVNPYKPAVRTGSPITGLTAWPNKGRLREVPDDGSGIPDDEQGFSGLGSLGFSLGPFDTGVYGSEYPSGPTKLQTIVGAIQATLPATIQAIRAQPSNIYPGQVYNPYATNAGGLYPGTTQGAGADVGARAGAAVGNVGDTIGGIVAAHPYLILAGGAALLLLFMNPPRRR